MARSRPGRGVPSSFQRNGLNGRPPGRGPRVRAREEERQRIANDIHDDPIRVMTAVGMRLSLVGRGVTDPAALSDLEQAEDTVRLAIERLRRLLSSCTP